MGEGAARRGVAARPREGASPWAEGRHGACEPVGRGVARGARAEGARAEGGAALGRGVHASGGRRREREGVREGKGRGKTHLRGSKFR
jgi:hypothetical protein